MSKETETVVVIDGGGRGATMVSKYSESASVKRLIAIPGNDLMHLNANGKEVETHQHLKTTSVDEIVEICRNQNVSLVDVTQENAIEAGLVDALEKNGIPVVGPTSAAGKIESSKLWARDLGKELDLEQPNYRGFDSPEVATQYLQSAEDRRRYVKADGLILGKGALSAKNNAEAIKRVEEMKNFGRAGEVFVIEDWIEGDGPGEEFSAFVLSDGQNIAFAGAAQDAKRAHNFDKGDQTGGMGAFSRPLAVTDEVYSQCQEMFQKVITRLNEMGSPYKGVLYLGGMIITREGKIVVSVVEWNSRWGDPEAEAIISSIQNDLFELSMQIAQGSLQEELKLDNKVRVAVAGASRGYPGDYSAVKGKQIFGIKEAMNVAGVSFYPAAIKEVDDKHYANGGRLFYVVGEGEDIIKARERAYEGISLIHVDGNNLHYRTDIGWRDVERVRKING